MWEFSFIRTNYHTHKTKKANPNAHRCTVCAMIDCVRVNRIQIQSRRREKNAADKLIEKDCEGREQNSNGKWQKSEWEQKQLAIK